MENVSTKKSLLFWFRLSNKSKNDDLHPAAKKRISRYYFNNDNFLTQREYEVYSILVATPKASYKLIGKQLNLSPRTIEFYLKSMRVKVGAYSKFNLALKLKKIELQLNKGGVMMLSQREQEIMTSFGTGILIKEIARKMKLTERTVEFYLKTALKKTELKNRQKESA